MTTARSGNPTVLELLDRGAVTPEAIVRLAETYLSTPGLRLYTLAFGFVLDITAAVQAYPIARAVADSSLSSFRSKRATVTTAIMLASPEKV